MHFFLKSLRTRQDGVVTVELAFFASIMMLTAIPVFDLISAIHESMRLTTAMRAGTYYAYRKPADTAGIETVLRAASPLKAAHLTVTNAQFCTCSGTIIDCTATSGCGGDTAKYMSLTANYEIPLSASYPGMGNAYVLTKESTLRIQ